MQKISIIGAGNFGQAIAHILSKKPEYEVLMWDTDSSKVHDMKPIAEVLSGSEIIFLCVPSWSLRSAGESLKQYISNHPIIICPTKGVEDNTLKTSEEVLVGVFQDTADIALLHGPMLAAEIMQNLPAFSVIACTSKEGYEKINQLFSETLLQLEYSEDIHGVALAGVLKNIYSIGLGMADALALGSNFRGWYVRIATREMSQIISALGGNAETALTGAGIGDMIATGFSPHSRNCTVGHEIVQSGECSTVSEGGESLPAMMQLLAKAGVEAPLCAGIAKLVAGEAGAPHIDKVIASCVS
ncbi:MAG: NAD(P)H-dependent glycerol-3-phosphate dehydrogenase [Candidatus Andersenbacteria bacterium]